MQTLRKEALMAQQIETGMLFMKMVGIEEARAYWQRANIPEAIVERLVHGNPRRGATPSGGPVQANLQEMQPPQLDIRVNLFYCSTGRRQDMVCAAVVQAAVAIKDELGSEQAMDMLRREGLDEALIDRVLFLDGGRRRTP